MDRALKRVGIGVLALFLAFLLGLLLPGCADMREVPVADPPTVQIRRVKVLFIERADGLWEVHVPTPTGTLASVASDENDARRVAEEELAKAWR